MKLGSQVHCSAPMGKPTTVRQDYGKDSESTATLSNKGGEGLCNVRKICYNCSGMADRLAKAYYRKNQSEQQVNVRKGKNKRLTFEGMAAGMERSTIVLFRIAVMPRDL